MSSLSGPNCVISRCPVSFKTGRPFEAICFIIDFKASFPTENPLFPARNETLNYYGLFFFGCQHSLYSSLVRRRAQHLPYSWFIVISKALVDPT